MWVVFSHHFAFEFFVQFWELIHFLKWLLGSLVFWFLMVLDLLVDAFLFLCLFLLEMTFNCGDALLFFYRF